VRRPGVTLDELRAWLVETHGVEASLGLMPNTLEHFHADRNLFPILIRSRT
jgi:hypothetical protein